MNKSQRIFALAASAVLIAASCGGSGESSGSSASGSSPATDPPATDPPATDPPTTDPPTPPLPDTPVVAMLNGVYAFDGPEPDFALLPALPNEVEAHWFSSGDVLAVVFAGCQSTSTPAQGTRSVLQQVLSSSAMLRCQRERVATFRPPSKIPQVKVFKCDDRVGYLSLIPTGTAGTLFSSIEKPDPDVVRVGITGFVDMPDPSVLPEISLDQLAC